MKQGPKQEKSGMFKCEGGGWERRDRIAGTKQNNAS